MWLCMRTCTHVQSSPQLRANLMVVWGAGSDIRTVLHIRISNAKRYLEGGGRSAAAFEAWVQIRAHLCAAEAPYTRPPWGVAAKQVDSGGACALSVLAAMPAQWHASCMPYQVPCTLSFFAYTMT